MTEIERKFLVEYLPNGRSEPVLIEQAYIALDGNVEVRVRRRNGTCSLTVKGGSGLERSEVELTLDHDDAEALWMLVDGRTIDKRRSTVEIKSHVSAPYAYLMALGVHPIRQGLGLATRVIEEVAHGARSLGYRTLALRTENPSNVGLYEHLGFELHARHTAPTSGIDVAVMSKPL